MIKYEDILKMIIFIILHSINISILFMSSYLETRISEKCLINLIFLNLNLNFISINYLLTIKVLYLQYVKDTILKI